MMHHSQKEYGAGRSTLLGQVEQLAHMLALIEEMAGRQPAASLDLGSARIAALYDAAPPALRHQADMLADETIGWATASAEALIGGGSIAVRPSRAAACCLGDELTRALRRLEVTLN